MFRPGKDKADESDGSTTEKSEQESLNTPPLKPFSKGGSLGTSRSQPGSFRPEIPRRVVEIPGAPTRSDQPTAMNSESDHLKVGRNICLSGEITSCERLIVEGRVEATLTDARVIEISQTGFFKGNAEVDEAEISGQFEGNLVARNKLVIHKEGQVNGSVRYGRIIIESGGEISGDMASLDDAGGGEAETQPLSASGSTSFTE